MIFSEFTICRHSRPRMGAVKRGNLKIKEYGVVGMDSAI